MNRDHDSVVRSRRARASWIPAPAMPLSKTSTTVC